MSRGLPEASRSTRTSALVLPVKGGTKETAELI